MVEDMITLLEGSVQPELRKGKYPDRKTARRISEVVKAVAQELDASRFASSRERRVVDAVRQFRRRRVHVREAPLGPVARRPSGGDAASLR